MKILVSACLLGHNCKYNGGSNRNARLIELLEGHTVIPVCPEVLGGLPVPRDPAEIVNGTVRTADGRSVDAEFRSGAQQAMRIALESGAELAVLQSRSPSCGPKEVYDGTFSRKKISGHGIFAGMLLDAGFCVLDIEELEEREAHGISL